jgi:predicted nucleic-acid-binding protein
MIGLDTNVLVRYLALDDPKQATRATRLIEQELSVSEPGFISLVVLAELCWVLARLYRASQEEIKQTVDDLLATPQFHLERREVVQSAVQRAKGGQTSKGDFVDALIAQTAQAEGCSHIVTFDKAAARGAGMKLLV